MNEILKKLFLNGSRKMSGNGSKKTAYQNFAARRENLKQIEKINKGRRNHVTKDDLSPGGFPFHFAGPKKG